MHHSISIRQSIDLSVCQFISLSVHQSVSLSVHQSVCHTVNINMEVEKNLNSQVISSSFNHSIIMRTHRWPYGPCLVATEPFCQLHELRVINYSQWITGFFRVLLLLQNYHINGNYCNICVTLVRIYVISLPIQVEK